MRISTQLLEAFVALEECRHFTQAAERCNLTQSAFSQLVRRLEAAVGVRLFDRHTRSVRPTPEGVLFSPHAHRILAAIDGALTEMRDYAEGKRGKLALAINPSLAASWLPAVLDDYVRSHPSISIQVFDTWPERGLQLLKEGQVDLAIGSEPGSPGECDVKLLFREPFLLACSARHPIAGRRLLQLKHLAGLEMTYPIQIDNTRVLCGTTLHRLRPLLRSAGVQETRVDVEHMTTIVALIGAGMGVSIVPELYRKQIVAPGVVLVPIARNAIQREVYLSQRIGQSLSVAAKSFVEVIERHIPRSR